MWRLLASVVAGSLIAATPAAAQVQSGRFFGTFAGGRTIELSSDENGRAGGARVVWKVRCGPLNTPTEVITGLSALPRTTSTREFAAADDETLDDPPGDVQVRIDSAVTGRRHAVRGRPGSESWSGTFEATVEVRETSGSERLLKRCEIRRTRWRAWREGYGTGRWAHVSDPGDWIGGGQPRTFDRSNSTMVAFGDREKIEVHVLSGPNDWDAEFRVPEGQALRRGGRYGAPDISGPGRGCNERGGEFTVRSVRYRRGRMRDVTIDFVQFCDSETAALRGTIEWRSSR